MVILSGEVIYNRIEQGLIYILGILSLQSKQDYKTLGMIISSGEYIISHESQRPMRMQKRRSL